MAKNYLERAIQGIIEEQFDFRTWDMGETLDVRNSFPVLCKVIITMLEHQKNQTFLSGQACLETLEQLPSQGLFSDFPLPLPISLIHSGDCRDFNFSSNESSHQKISHQHRDNFSSQSGGATANFDSPRSNRASHDDKKQIFILSGEFTECSESIER